MKLKKIIPLGLAAILLATPTCTTWAHEYNAPASNDSALFVSPRFAYIMSADIKVDPSSSGVNYSVRVSGISKVTSISGTMTIYRDGTSIYTKKLSTSKSELRASGTIPTKGSGTYKITFSGTVYTDSGSETIDMDMEDSY